MHVMNITDLSIIVPCFNEEDAIPEYYKETIPVLSELQENNIIKEYEIIFIDDGSKDNTLLTLKNLSKQNSSIKYFSFSKNFGKEAAILCGLQHSIGKYTAIMDADLQDPPSLLPKMLEAVMKNKDDGGGYDCAGTRRITRKGEPILRSFFARNFYKIMRDMTDIDVVDGARDFRLMTRTMVNAIISMPERIRFSKGIFPWVGFKTKWFEYENIERKQGETKWSFWTLFLYSLDGITSFSSKPLVIASTFGIISLLIAFFLVVFIIIRKITFGDPTVGWPSMVCVILTIGGIQLFSIGILGQYIAKIYTEVKQRPSYIVKESNYEE